MGLFDWFSSWFSSNKDTLSTEQRYEMQRLLDRMRLEMQDNINSATTNTTRRMEELIRTHTGRLQSDIADNKNYVNIEMKRMSDELEKVKKQLDEEEKKKKQEKEEKTSKLLDEYKSMVDLMKQQMELLQKTNCPPSGYPPHPGYYPWQASVPPPGPGFHGQPYYPNPPSEGFGPSMGSGFHPNHQPSAPPAPSTTNSKDSPKKVILPDTRDYKKCGIELEAKDLVNVPKKSNSPERKARSKNHPSVELEPEKDDRRSSLGQLKLTSKSAACPDSQLGCSLILPDSRDYNKVITASVQKKLKEEEFDFDKMVDNFNKEFRPAHESNPSSSGISQNRSSTGSFQNRERKIADGVHNFFLRDLDHLNNRPKQPSSRTNSSDASVKKWLQETEQCSRDDDGNESDTSDVSVRTDVSRFSTMSATSGKRVFWNKQKNYGKPAPAAKSSEDANKNKPFEHKKKTYRNTNSNRQRNTKKENPNTYQKQNASNSSQRQTASDSTSVASSKNLAEINYPSEREARQQGLDFLKPLARELLFLGQNEDKEWTTHKPKHLKDIYDLEKKYKVFKTIEIS